jgi:hypothetical protein
VCRRAALRATDDPDTKDGIDHASGTWWHVWDEWGETWGGAPEAVRVWFRRTQRRLDAGREGGPLRRSGRPDPHLGQVDPAHRVIVRAGGRSRRPVVVDPQGENRPGDLGTTAGRRRGPPLRATERPDALGLRVPQSSTPR